jgi:hypothetical protein
MRDQGDGSLGPFLQEVDQKNCILSLIVFKNKQDLKTKEV